MNARLLSRIALPLAALALAAAGCFSYDDAEGPETEDVRVDTVEDTVDDTVEDTTADGSGVDADEDALPDAGPTLPEYVRVSCEERTPVDGRVAVTPPACDYEVVHPFGMKGIVESCGSATDVPVGLHLTYPAEDAGTTIAVMWSTPETTRESVVRVGTSPDALDRVYWGHSFTYAGLTGRVSHEVHLCGLEPGRTYYYQAGGEGAWSDTFSFSTAPAWDSDEEIVFAVTGDSRSDTFEIWGDAVQRIRDMGAEFIVFSGDAVEAGPVQVQWDRFFEQGQPGLAEMPIMPANGNHDLLVAPWFGQFALPNDEINFTVRYGQLVFVSMTDFYPADQLAVGSSFAQYMDAAFGRHTDAGWRFLNNHRPFYSASTRHGSAQDLQDDWGPIVDRHGVDLVFNGHDHNYERSRPIRQGAVVPFGEGTIYTVIAGVGAPLYDNGAQWWTETSEKVGSFAIIRVSGDRLEFTAYRVDGTQLDRFVWER